MPAAYVCIVLQFYPVYLGTVLVVHRLKLFYVYYLVQMEIRALQRYSREYFCKHIYNYQLLLIILVGAHGAIWNHLTASLTISKTSL